jgi:murein DD-endopeptidase MepM/ murein hydrolase activator NlpD
MKSGRSHIIWIPRNGSEKIRKSLIRPSFIRLFSFVVIVCICSVPFLETVLLTLTKRINDLEQKKQELEGEILQLQYVRRKLVRIEQKEKMLRDYFGMERYRSLEQIMGGGGNLNLMLSQLNSHQDKNKGKSDKNVVSPNISLPMKLKILNSNYEILNQLILKKQGLWETTPSIVPLALRNPRISSGFGWRKNPFTDKREFHAGIDIVGPKGTKIIAPACGVVITKGYDRWLGNYLVLQHTEEIKTIYGHLNKIPVNKGDRVKRGDLLGFIGNTGMSTSRHLHYGVIVNNRAVDPMQYIMDKRG